MKALKKAFKTALQELGASLDEVFACAEYMGRYIYLLTAACQELYLFLWLDDPTRIKNSMGLTRGKKTMPSMRPESPNMLSGIATKLSDMPSRMRPWYP